MSGPFTAANLRPILAGVLKQGMKWPGDADLKVLARSLNQIRGIFVTAQKTANKSKPADKVGAALAVLMVFFDERRAACCGSPPPSPQIVESERRLYDQFYAFVQAMKAHDFQLDMDAGLLMPKIDRWQHLARAIAAAFEIALAPNNGWRSRLSNDGPVPRFVARVAGTKRLVSLWRSVAHMSQHRILSLVIVLRIHEGRLAYVKS